MAKKYLIVIDMQRDFITGALGTKEARAILDHVVRRIQKFDGEIIFTKDTHGAGYLETQEGKNLPVKHCIKGTPGWELEEPLGKICKDMQCKVYEKPFFGSTELAGDFAHLPGNEIISIELIGVCTDICVVSNALLLKVYLPEIPVIVRADCCAGTTPEKHQAALSVLESCQVEVIWLGRGNGGRTS